MITNTILNENNWRWIKFQKYLMSKLDEFNCKEYKVPAEFLYKESLYGSKKDRKNAKLFTYASHNDRINFCRSVCIISPTYSVLNFLIIPNILYNFPFLGIDFVTLPKYHLIVMDFQPSISVNRQFEKNLLSKLIKLKDDFHDEVPRAESMSQEMAGFFSPGVIWAKLPSDKSSDVLINNYLYPTFEKYLNLYFTNLFKAEKENLLMQRELSNGQDHYLNFRKRKDPARPMLKVLFGESYTESLINNLLFKVI